MANPGIAIFLKQSLLLIKCSNIRAPLPQEEVKKIKRFKNKIQIR
jgi:hypothetical protein